MAQREEVSTVIEDYAEPITTRRTTWLGLSPYAVLEVVLFTVALLALDLFFFDGDRFWGTRPHPFWIIVLLVSVQYGTTDGLFAALFCSVALLVGNLPEQRISQDMYDLSLEISYRPLLWLTATVFIGGLRARQIQKMDALTRALAERDTRLEKISKAYDHVNKQKDKLEGRVAGQLNTAIELYNTARRVEKLDPAKVIVSSLDLVRTILVPTKCSIFLLVDDMLQAGIQSGWSEEDTYLRFFRADNKLFRAVIAERRFLNIARAEDEALLMGQGVLAGPMINRDSGEITGMLKIEALPFLNLNLSTVKSFEVLCEWVGGLLANAEQHREAELNTVAEAHGLMSQRMYDQHLTFLSGLSSRLGFEVCVVKIQLRNPHKLAQGRRELAARILAEVVDASLRTTDYAFDVLQRGWSYAILLPGNNLEGAYIVLEKLRIRFGTRLAEEVPEAVFTIEAEKLA